MSDPEVTPVATAPAATKSIAIPTTIITGVILAVVIAVAYVFGGPDAAKAVCSAVL